MSSPDRDSVPSPRPKVAKEVPLVDRAEARTLMNALKEAVQETEARQVFY